MNYIKREDVLKLVEKGFIVGNSNYKSVTKFINDIPAADVIEHKTGKWKMGKYDIFTVRCSECFETNGSFTNFCPNCGAEMTNGKIKT